MNRVITINLNGIAYQLEESGYEALRTYLDNAARRLEGNPDKEEIIADIEQAIADKFRTVLGANKNVVITREVECVLVEMGPVQDGGAADEAQASGAARPASGAKGTSTGPAGVEFDPGSPGAAKRLYTIKEGAMLAGVCNGLAAYLNIDVTIIRILFVILTLFWGTGALVYLVMAMIIPTANTPAEKAAAHGAAATAQEFIRRAREGYYEGMKTFQDKHARREWKRKFKQEMRSWKQNFQHEIHRNAQGWRQPQAQPPSYGVGPALGAPVFWLINTLITIIALYALYSLVTSGMAYGITLPAGVPLWIGIVGLIVVWRLVAWPFKAMQWNYYYRRGHAWEKCTGPFGSFGDFISGLAFLVLIVWVADRYVPQFHESLKQLPPLLHQGVDSVQHWLEKH